MHFVTAREHDVVIENRLRVEAKGAGRVRVVGRGLRFWATEANMGQREIGESLVGGVPAYRRIVLFFPRLHLIVARYLCQICLRC